MNTHNVYWTVIGRFRKTDQNQSQCVLLEGQCVFHRDRRTVGQTVWNIPQINSAHFSTDKSKIMVTTALDRPLEGTFRTFSPRTNVISRKLGLTIELNKTHEGKAAAM